MVTMLKIIFVGPNVGFRKKDEGELTYTGGFSTQLIHICVFLSVS